jgi:hypothetical protein
MAILIKKIFGNLSGALGDSVFRNRYGKVVAYSRPSKQRISKSVASKKARKQFALTVVFAKKINSLPALAEIWRKAKISGTSSYHRIIKYNNKLTSVGCLTVNNIIVPQGSCAAVTDINRIDDTITIYFAYDFNELLKDFDDDVNLVVIVYLYKKRQWLTPEFMVFDKTVSIKVQDTISNVAVDLKSLNIPFNKYENAIFYTAVLFGKGDTNIKRCSNTFAREIVNV